MKKSWRLNRRMFLRSAGVSVALPMMEAMIPTERAAAARAVTQPARMLCIGVHLGMYGPAFFPKKAGGNYTSPTLLKPIEEFRKDFTVFSNLDHAGVGKGHPATVNYLTGVENPKKRKQMSLDQFAARAVGSQTRFASLQLEAKPNNQKGRPLSWAQGGIPLPMETDPRAVLDRLFSRPQDAAKLKESLAILFGPRVAVGLFGRFPKLYGAIVKRWSAAKTTMPRGSWPWLAVPTGSVA